MSLDHSSQERAFGGSIVALGSFPVLEAKPCKVWDSNSGWPERYFESPWEKFFVGAPSLES